MRLMVAVVVFALAFVSLPAQAFDQTTFDVQQALSQLGYDVGTPDGVSGPQTRSAITQFATDYSLPPSSDMSVTLDQLRSLAERAREAVASKVDVVPQVGYGWMVAVSPDDHWVASERSGSLLLGDLKAGRTVATLQGHTQGIEDYSFSPDSKYLATASSDETVRIWDLATRTTVNVLDIGSSVDGVSFSPDGKTIATTGYSSGLQLWDSTTLRRLAAVDEEPDGVFFSPDGARVFVSEKGGLSSWAVPSLSTRQKFRAEDFPEAWFYYPTISADGSFVAAVTIENANSNTDLCCTLTVWNTDSRREILALGTSFSPGIFVGNTEIATSANGSIEIHTLADGALVRAVKSTGDDVGSMRQLGDARLAATLEDGSVEVVDLRADRVVLSIETLAEITLSTGLVSSSAGTHVGLVGKTGSFEFDLSTGTGTAGPRFSATGYAVLGETGGAVMTDEGALLFDRDNPENATSTGDHSDGAINDPLNVSPDGRYVVVFDEDYLSIRVYEVHTGRLLHEMATERETFASLVTSDNRLIVSYYAVGGETGVTIWDLASGEVVRRLKNSGDSVVAMAASEDGALLLTAEQEGDTINLWNIKTGKRLRNLKVSGLTTESPLSLPDALALSPDGTMFAGRGSNGLTKVVELDSGKVIQTIRGPLGGATMSFSPDGQSLLVGPYGLGVVQQWSIATGRLQMEYYAFHDGEWVTVTPEGFFSASENGAENLVLVRGLESYSIDQAYDALYRPDLVAEALKGDPNGLVAAAAAKLDLTTVIESGSAPSVVIASPSTGSTIDADSIEVAASITDAGGGIGKIEWRVNGITLGVESRGFDRLAVDTQVAAAEPVVVSKQLSLDPGENLIEVVAYNEKGLIASDPASVTVTWDGVSASTPPRLYVVSVGVNDYYDSRLQLTYASSDARAIGAAFATAGGSLYESVEVTTVLDGDVTAAGLDAVFTELSGKVRPRDVFVLFMAGHGKTQDGRYYFLPQDFRYVDESSIASGGIDQDQFQEWLSRIAARKSVLLYDTCDSGSLTNGVASRGLEEVAALARMTRAMGRTVLSASTDDAPALEGYNGHGVFTYALLQALGEGDVNSDGTIEVTELAGSIDKAVPEISYAAFNLRQIPQMSIVGSDFPIASQIRVLSAETPATDTASDIPTAPTHVVIAETQVHEAPDEASSAVQQLEPGTQIRVITIESGWARVAIDAGEVGYVRSTGLLKLR